MYAPTNTRSDGGIRLAGLGYRGPITEIDYPWRPDDSIPRGPVMVDFEGGGGGIPSFFDQPPPISGEAKRTDPGDTYYAYAATQDLPAAPDVVSFNPPQGQVTVITQPGETPRVVVQAPGVSIDTSRIGQPAPSVEGTIGELQNWLQQKTIFSAAPNWLVLLGGFVAYKMLAEGKS